MYQDWHLPSKEEWEKIAQNFNDYDIRYHKYLKEGIYWSSSAAYNNKAWFIYLLPNSATFLDKTYRTDELRVLPIRFF